jgi:hypothetical protein
MGKRKPAKDTAIATERDQFWLDHEVAQAASGQTTKDYATAQGVSLQALYQARKRLRALGLLGAARREAPKRSGRTPVSFAQIQVTPDVNDARFRVQMPSGITLEWSGGEVPESVVVLLERLSRPA